MFDSFREMMQLTSARFVVGMQYGCCVDNNQEKRMSVTFTLLLSAAMLMKFGTTQAAVCYSITLPIQ